MATVTPTVTESQQALADLIEAYPDYTFHELHAQARGNVALRPYMSAQKFGLLITQLIEWGTIEQNSDTFRYVGP